jgi:hypothetical protein
MADDFLLEERDPFTLLLQLQSILMTLGEHLAATGHIEA